LGITQKVMKFVKNTNFTNTAAYYFSIATYEGIVENDIWQLSELLNEHSITLNYGEKIRMVGNYIRLV
jgi:hypothetical protein